MEQLEFSEEKAQLAQNMTSIKEYLKVSTNLKCNQMYLRHLKYLIKSNMNCCSLRKDIELQILKISIRIALELHSLIQLIIFKILIKNLKTILQN
jgi:hypothetical protein